MPVIVVSSSARFFADLRTDPAVIALVECTRVSMLSPLSSSFTMPYARVTWVELADEDTLNAFFD